MYRSRLTYLFTKYINRKSTPEERHELFELIKAEDNDVELKALIDRMVNETEVDMYLSAQSADTVLHNIIGEEKVDAAVRSTGKKKSLKAVWISVAAIFITGLFISRIFYQSPMETDVNIEVPAMVSHPEISVSTLSGERKNIHLADGTQVWLSPSSTLKYPGEFKDTQREVRLSGEAFFEVAPDKSHPFVIYSSGIETKVLGTSFNISAYDSQEEVAVTVVTGKVNVTNTAGVEKIELNANQRAVFYKPTTKLVKERKNVTDAPDMLKRKEGMFVYRDERLQKLIGDLEEYFGRTVHVAEQIKDCKVMANFYVTDHLLDILEPIALSVNGTVEINNDEFFISGEGCPK